MINSHLLYQLSYRGTSRNTRRSIRNEKYPSRALGPLATVSEAVLSKEAIALPRKAKRPSAQADGRFLDPGGYALIRTGDPIIMSDVL